MRLDFFFDSVAKDICVQTIFLRSHLFFIIPCTYEKKSIRLKEENVDVYGERRKKTQFLGHRLFTPINLPSIFTSHASKLMKRDE